MGTRAKTALAILLALGLLTASGCIQVGQEPGGMASADGVLYVATLEGKILALQQDTHVQKWEWEPEDGGAGGGFGCSSGVLRGGILYATPVLKDGVIYIGTYEGTVYAVNDTGGDRWKYDTDSAIVGSVALAGDTLFVGLSSGELLAMDTNTQKPKNGFGPFKAGDKIWSTPVVEGDTVYVSSLDHKLYALDAETGEQRWEQPFEADGGIAATLLISGGTIYIGSFDKCLYALDAETGEPKEGFETFEAGDWFWSRPLLAEGVLYIGSLDGNLYALDAESGAELWRFPTDGPIRSWPVIVEGKVLAVGSEDGHVYGVDPISGLQEWVFDTSINKGVPRKAVRTPLHAEDGIIYVSCLNHYIYALDSEGNRLWEKNTE